MMPLGGADARAEQTAALELVCHDLLTSPDTGDLLHEADNGGLDPWEAANLVEIRRRWAHANALNAKLVEALSKASSDCEIQWRRARAEDGFSAFSSSLDGLLGLVRESAAAKAEALDLDPYDALLDEFEPGGRAKEIDLLFQDLAAFLPDFLAQVLDAQAGLPDLLPLAGPFPISAQRDLARRLMTAIGFDFDHGRLDVSGHPFCGGTPDDVRITTRYEEDDFVQALMGVLHETGHALYERGLPVPWRYQPVGQARGMGIHESQSLLLEMQVCRGREFLGFAAPLVREAFGGSGPAWSVDNLFRVYTRVKPDFIRVDADEVTYPLHVMLRYRLERALIAGDLAVADLPGAWNDGMNDLLGIRPPDDSRGCLQDIHWAMGLYGYFPTYTLGAMTAAQLFASACRADANIKPAIAAGNFAPLITWLRTNVHALGSFLPGPELIARASGRPLGTEAYKAHLKKRYLPC